MKACTVLASLATTARGYGGFGSLLVIPVSH